MSKHGSKSNMKQSAAKRHAQDRSMDRAIYISIVMVAAFVLFIWFMVADTWPWAIVGFLLAVLGMINFFTWKVIQGQPLAVWQRSLAKLPLRFVGYGTRGGKPIDAAKGQDAAKMALYLTAAISVVIVLASWAVVARFVAT